MSNPSRQFRMGRMVTGSVPIIDPEHPTFGCDGTGVVDATTGMQAALNAAGAAGGCVHLKAGRVFSCGNIDIPAGVTVISDNAEIVRRTYGGVSTGMIDMAAGSRIVGHLRIDGDSGNVTGVGGTDSHYAVQVNGDNVFIDSLEVEGFASGYAYHLQVTNADFCHVRSLTSRAASYASIRLTSSSAKLDLFRVDEVVSENAVFKGFVYNGTGGIGDIWFGRAWFSTNTTQDASNGFQIDSGDADPAVTDTSQTIRVDRLTIDNLYAAGHRSDGAKIQHTRYARIGHAAIFPATALATRAGLRAWNPNMEVGSIETSERVIAYGNIRIGSLDYTGAGDRAIECNGMLGERAWIGRLHILGSTISSAPVRVSRGVNRMVHLEAYDSTTQQPFAFASPAPDNQVCVSIGAGVLSAQTNSGITNSTDNDKVHRPPRQIRRTAVPAAGTWVRNDICWNTTPTATGYVGWVCVTAGTPGTWKGFGEIEA